jgi:signal transduction histidine kinase
MRALARRWLPRRSVRLRLTLLYGALFLIAGAALLGITYALVANQTGKKTVVFQGKVRQPGKAVGTRTLSIKPGAAIPGRSAIQYGERVARDTRSQQLRELLTWSGVGLGGMALVSIALGWLMAGRVLRPLRTMTATTRRISEDNLHERLALTGPNDELKELGDTIDELLARLDSAFEAQRRFVANASHELRTPLTYERAMIEVALADPAANEESLREVCRRVLAAGEQQERVIEALLTLARSQRGLDRREPFDLAALAEAAIANVELPVDADLRPAPAAGDPRLAERLVCNLVDNASRHNVPGGWVRVSTAGDGERSRLRISNSGPTIAPGEVDALLEPFRRAAPERSAHGHGHGLGLSIAASIAAAHGATLRLRARPEGGLEVEVSFPYAGTSARTSRPRASASAASASTSRSISTPSASTSGSAARSA